MKLPLPRTVGSDPNFYLAVRLLRGMAADHAHLALFAALFWDDEKLDTAMRALPNDRWREFCHELVTGPQGHGSLARAARIAGFGAGSKPAEVARIAQKILHDDRMIAALAEESRKNLRAGHPEAVAAAKNIVRDPNHKDHARVVLAMLDRVDPVVSKQNIEVTHKIADPDQEALEELQALRQIGATREKLLELFGGNGLGRLERLEAADIARRAAEANSLRAR